jgi:hypothetical protein
MVRMVSVHRPGFPGGDFARDRISEPIPQLALRDPLPTKLVSERLYHLDISVQKIQIQRPYPSLKEPQSHR